jgi:FkbM family methyltransferase
LTISHYATLFPDAKILGIELDAGNLAMCERNIAPHGARCRVIHGAVWSDTGQVAYSGDAEWAFHVSPEVTSGQTVTSYTVDALIQMLCVDTIDFLKIDIEGAEAEILAQAASWIGNVRALKVEIHPPFTIEACDAVLRGLGVTTSIDDRHPRCIIGRTARK